MHSHGARLGNLQCATSHPSLAHTTAYSGGGAKCPAVQGCCHGSTPKALKQRGCKWEGFWLFWMFGTPPRVLRTRVTRVSIHEVLAQQAIMRVPAGRVLTAERAERNHPHAKESEEQYRQARPENTVGGPGARVQQHSYRGGRRATSERWQ